MEALKLLSRNEMKNISGGYIEPDVCTCNQNGCGVSVHQYTNYYTVTVQCAGDSGPSSWSYNGSYSGSACGGEC